MKLLETQFINPPMSFSLLDPNLLITNLLCPHSFHTVGIILYSKKKYAASGDLFHVCILHTIHFHIEKKSVMVSN
jgi:hypothetical protein